MYLWSVSVKIGGQHSLRLDVEAATIVQAVEQADSVVVEIVRDEQAWLIESAVCLGKSAPKRSTDAA